VFVFLTFSDICVAGTVEINFQGPLLREISTLNPVRPSIAIGAFQKIVAPVAVYCATTPCGASCAVIIAVGDAEGVADDVVAGVELAVTVEVAVGVGEGLTPSLPFTL
jgi:hypothetical protein